MLATGSHSLRFAMSYDATRYQWWIQRLTQMSMYFHAYRIDHILGFFRIWQIPAHGVTGLLGQFNPSNAIPKWELEAAGIWDFDRLCSALPP